MLSIRNLFLTLVLGLITGLLAAGFFKVLFFIQDFQSHQTMYLYLMPVLWIVLRWIKQNTLYFPTTVSGVHKSDDLEYKYWSRLSIPLNFVGASLSHLVGASVGREGAVVVFASGVGRLLGLDLKYFKPILMAAGFAIAMDHPWIALVFIYEMFSTRIDQKLFAVLAAWVGCLVLRSFQLPALFDPILVVHRNDFWDLFFFVLILSLSVGYGSRLYKWIFQKIKTLTHPKKQWGGFLLVVVLTAVLWLPEFKSVHSLSLTSFEQIKNGIVSEQFLLMKFLITVVSVAIGFWGGDFVPSVVLGSGWAVWLAPHFKVDPQMALMLGTFSFFAALNLLKWTAFFLTLSAFGSEHFMWLYFCLTLVKSFSGNISLYRQEP